MAERRAAAKAAKRDRVMSRNAFLAGRGGEFDQAALDAAVSAKLAEPAPKTRGRGVQPKGFPTGNTNRWVPIGPSVVRLGQGSDRPRVTGRIRDLWVDHEGLRAYAASARGGVWYSGDGGGTWAPVGGWAERARGAGGSTNAQSCGCLLVDFGVDAEHDFVMVGTGETLPFDTGLSGRFGGVGVLAAAGPAAKPISDNPWEDQAGLAVLAGQGVFRLARDPSSTAGSTSGATTDRVLAATSTGLYLGTRTAGPPDSFTWVRLGGTDALLAVPPVHPPDPFRFGRVVAAVCDVLWLPGGTQGRIVVAIERRGVAFSDDGGGHFHWVDGLSWPVGGQTVQGVSSISRAPGTNTLYVLTGLKKTAALHLPTDVDDDSALFRIADYTAATPAATRVRGVPTRLWPGQRDYDQALEVDVVTVGAAQVHRVYLGGSFWQTTPNVYDASLWCFDVVGTDHLGPATGISRVGVPGPGASAGEGAAVAGLIGQGVHADVHVVRLTGDAGARQVWVGCDGGVYVSAQAGRALTFAPRCTGLATLEVEFSAVHPSSSHLVVSGIQDNGTQLRSGDTVWEEVFVGDGGGVAIDPVNPHRFVRQYIRAGWSASTGNDFSSPTSRRQGGGTFVGDREDGLGVASFYSGSAATVSAAGTTRLAVGTNRVWLTDDLGTLPTNSWLVLPITAGGPAVAAVDARPAGTDPPALQPFGDPVLGTVVALKWAAPTILLALYDRGVVSYVETAPGSWTGTTVLQGAAIPGATFSDLAPVPGSADFYLTTLGVATNPVIDTLYLFDSASGNPVASGLRHLLDVGGVLGPLDPAYAVVVDPKNPREIYVGTVTGVWHGVRDVGATTITWPTPPTPFVNGLPQAAVQDLTIHYDPAHESPRLLRASMQSRGVWELDLAAASEPVRTYLRVHSYDDRRRLPTPMAELRLPAPAPPLNAFESPDVTVRPQAAAGIAPPWVLGAGGSITSATMTAGNAPTYQLWTFQTAFRWIFSSVAATGRWSGAFEGLVRQRRADAGLPAGPMVDKALWDDVVGTRIHPVSGQVSTTGTHPLAVYQPAWRSPFDMTAHATEIDLLESVQPVNSAGGIWSVHKERCTVDVLLHHRDTRPLAADASRCVLLWREAATVPVLTGLDISALAPFVVQCAGGTVPAAIPGGWRIGGPGAGAAVSSLGLPLDARIPRAVSFDVDFADPAAPVPDQHFVMFLAFAWSTADQLGAVPSLPTTGTPTVADLVRGWPYAAMRIVQVIPRPVPLP